MYSRYVVSQVKNNGYFLVGLAVGLYLALACVPLEDEPSMCATAASPAALNDDDYEPVRSEARASADAAAPRALQRPRYYSTELGIRERLFVGVLTTAEALGGRAAALNATALSALPVGALKFFMSADALAAERRLPNVVGFTDSREMLKPFHVLKYIADNHLEEYDFFFLLGDSAFLNVHRLVDLVRGLSVSEDVYMGTPADDDSQYCSLDKGILISNSVLRNMHGSLDWCVRNSYSAHHHENLGRCVLHSAQLKCTTTLQGQEYASVSLSEEAADAEAEAEARARIPDAVSAFPVADADAVRLLHAHAAEALLERAGREARALRRALARLTARHPPGFRNATWPGGLRADAGMAPPPPDSRFDLERWTRFNATHAFAPDERHALAALTGARARAVSAVLREAWAWAAARWPALRPAALLEGHWRWEPARALRYRLLLRFVDGERSVLRLVEVCRPLGAARLVSVPYQTESARLSVLLPLAVAAEPAALAAHLDFLRRYETVCLKRDRKTALLVILTSGAGANSTAGEPYRRAVDELRRRYRDAAIDVAEYPGGGEGAAADEEEERWRAVRWGAARLARDALVLTAVPEMEWNEEFLNRARMNALGGRQWFSPVPFARFAQYAHPLFRAPDGSRPQVNTGRFDERDARVAAFARADYEAGARRGGPAPARALAALACVRAPEPGLVLRPAGAPCGRRTGAGRAACRRRLRGARFAGLNLGARHSLARLLLETGLA